MNPTQAAARRQRAEEADKRRHAEALCAWDFLVNGDLRGEHAAKCVRPGGVVCSREYDPGPAPEDERLYEGTTLGALWGLPTSTEGTIAYLNAIRNGWDITRQRRAAS